MTKLIFRSGLRTIGGTIIELIHGEDRLVFDFGTVFNPKTEEKLPNVEGIYDNSSKYNDMVLISHLHLDHTKAMNMIHKDIPLVLNEQSVEFLEDLYKVSYNPFMGEKREYTKVKVNETFKHGSFNITNMLVDHDVMGASCFFIETNDLNLFYSGDLRLHGLNPERTLDVINYLKEKEVDVAIFEGVTVSFIDDDYKIIASNKLEKLASEKEYVELIEENVKEEGILFNPYIMGLERLDSLFKLAKKQDKEVFLTSKFSYMANKYYPDYDFKILEEDKYNIGKEVVQYNEINKNVIAIFDYNEKEKYPIFNETFALLQTGGEPLGDFDDRWEEFLDYSKDHNLKVYKIGSGGHASPENLIWILEQINPKIVMPLHSFKPEKVNSDKVKQIMVKEDKVYNFKNHILKED